ncbi:MAG: glutamyl-tRNA synthetase [bacterium P3]|nr:MAG: glutamyl-tRNA synthetase [bacterium P3]KWW38712.1 MAG: glutamyl-tRNA synthetase [bacterium F083]
MDQKVRVRFAPSPTGPLHIGGVRTALYNYLFARQNGGEIILRIEDTDQTRYVPGAEQYIIEALDWLGIRFDEGVHIGGPYGPYRQSDRKAIYRQYAEQLLRDGWAYYAFDKPETLDAKRKEYESQKRTFQYDCTTRDSMENSLSLTSAEVERRLQAGEHYVVRFKFPAGIDITVHDLIRGDVTMNSNLLDDKVLFKSDGMPTYHLANIVDDHSMHITHVIRGEEWLPSAPLHVMLYRAFGWEETMPRFAHLPLLLKPEGNGKLSKRDGDRLGFPVFPLDWHDPESGELSSGYRERGYLPEAVVNMLALLGWNPGTEQELFTMDELIDRFSIEHISKSGAKFNVEKARWFNHEYMQKLSDEEVAALFAPQLEAHNIKAAHEYIVKVCGMMKERVSFPGELWDTCSYFFEAPTTYDPAAVKKRWKSGMTVHMNKVIEILETVPFDYEAIHHALLDEYIAGRQLNTGQVMNSLRLAVVGKTVGPDMITLIMTIGKDETVRRVRRAIDTIGEVEEKQEQPNN